MDVTLLSIQINYNNIQSLQNIMTDPSLEVQRILKSNFPETVSTEIKKNEAEIKQMQSVLCNKQEKFVELQQKIKNELSQFYFIEKKNQQLEQDNKKLRELLQNEIRAIKEQFQCIERELRYLVNYQEESISKIKEKILYQQQNKSKVNKNSSCELKSSVISLHFEAEKSKNFQVQTNDSKLILLEQTITELKEQNWELQQIIKQGGLTILQDTSQRQTFKSQITNKACLCSSHLWLSNIKWEAQLEEIKYKGHLIEGIKNGKGISHYQYYQHRLEYEGNFILNSRSGFGILSCEEGSIYSGYWSNDIPNGRGKLFFDEESKIQSFEGEFKAGQINGHGTLSLKNGISISGKWTKGNLAGQAIIERYQGDQRVSLQCQKMQGIGIQHLLENI